MRQLRWLLVAVLLAVLTACSGNPILGKWETKPVNVMGISIDITPGLEFTRDTMKLNGQMHKVTYKTEGSTVHVIGESGIGLVVHVVDRDHIYTEIGGIRIDYTRVRDQQAARAFLI
ncbi:MAG: hypothetical protein HY028_04145 [Gammaproteobacteria bacterium]|nr:hypothetical protein [Gammaproteobacteria bacterium]